MLPMGVFIGGIYHSHIGAVFHSHVDEENIRRMMVQYRNAISIVTNGRESKVFMYRSEREYRVVKATPEFKKVRIKVSCPLQKSEVLKLINKITPKAVKGCFKGDSLTIELPGREIREYAWYALNTLKGKDFYKELALVVTSILSAYYNVFPSKISTRTVWYFDLPLTFVFPLREDIHGMLLCHAKRLEDLGYSEEANKFYSILGDKDAARCEI